MNAARVLRALCFVPESQKDLAVPRTTIVIRSLLLAVGTVVLVAGCEGRDTVGAGGGAGFVTQLPGTVVGEPSTAALVGDPSSAAAPSTSVAPSSSADTSAPTTTTTTTATTEPPTSAAPPPSTPEQPAAPLVENPAPTEAEVLEARVLEITNTERAANGCAALVFDERLAASARGHSVDMATQDYFDHVSKDGRTFVDRIRAAGYPSPGAENIAAGQPTAEAVMKGWMESKGHHDNIVNCDLKALGVGVAKGGSFGIYWTQNFGR